jgi:hypothetical protein
MVVYVYASFQWVSSSIEMNKRAIPPEISGDLIFQVQIFARKFLQKWYNMGTTYLHRVDFTTFVVFLATQWNACKDFAVAKVVVNYQIMIIRRNYRFPFHLSSDWLSETKALYFSELNPCSSRNGDDQIIDLTEQSRCKPNIPSFFQEFFHLLWNPNFLQYTPHDVKMDGKNPRLVGNCG